MKRSPHTRAPTFLREWRKFRRLSQEAAADRIEVAYTTIGKIERGILPYNQDFLERAAHAYGCEPHELLAVNPLAPNPPALVWEKLRKAPDDVQAKAAEIIEVLLKTA